MLVKWTISYGFGINKTLSHLLQCARHFVNRQFISSLYRHPHPFPTQVLHPSSIFTPSPSPTSPKCLLAAQQGYLQLSDFLWCPVNMEVYHWLVLASLLASLPTGSEVPYGSFVTLVAKAGHRMLGTALTLNWAVPESSKSISKYKRGSKHDIE